MFPSFFNTDNRSTGTRLVNECLKPGLGDINEKIAQDYIRSALERSEKEARDILYGDCFWRRIFTEKDLPDPEKYDYVLVRKDENVPPMIHRVADGIKKSDKNEFFELRNYYQITHWIPIPFLKKGGYIHF